MRTMALILSLLFTAHLHANVKGPFLEPANAKKIASHSLSGGGCTVTNQPFAFGAMLIFTCPETAWRVHVRNTRKGLQIRQAELRRTPTSPFMRIISEANIAEIFVPYHNGIDRLSDNQFCDANLCIRPTTQQDLGSANAELVTMQGATQPTAVVEIRDRGLVWMCKWNQSTRGPAGSKTRRGQEMVVWSTWDTGNYDYVIEYSFRDDGQVGFRLGATGYNNPNFPALGHMHDVLWRVDIDLNGSAGDTAVIARHTESGAQGIDDEIPFNNGKEGGYELEPLLFSHVIVEDSATNARGNHRGYELHPLRQGTARHVEAWTQDDVWVTRYRFTEPAVPGVWTSPDEYLLGNATNQSGIFNLETVANTDVVLWHNSPFHHDPHDEDQSPTDTGNGYRGLTLMHWTGFDLVPKNVFDYNPLGAPDRSGCDP